MPTLADIYSAADSFKRRLADAASNPSGALSQMLGYANDRARNFNELSGQAANEFQQRGGGFANQGPAGQALDQAYAESIQPVGMIVWHGSPHVFEKFDLAKLGTGEGNQAYGKGLYTAQNPEVAKTYISSGGVKPTSTPDAYAADLVSMMGNKEKALSHLKYVMPEVGETTFSGESRDLIQKAIQSIESGSYEKKIGNLYKVDLPDTHIRRMIDWDEPLKNQPVHVRNLAKTLGVDLNDLGGDLIGQIGKGEEGKQILQKAGIPGIKYLDQASRNASGWHITDPSQTVSKKWMVKSSDYNSKGVHFDTEQEAKDYMKQKLGEATRNFVVFDPNHLTILERNAKPIK